MPALQEKCIALLSKTAIADLSSTTETTVYTVPIGKTCILTESWLKVAGDVGANLAFTVGQDGAETDWLNTQNGDNLDADLDCSIFKPVASATPPTLKEYVAGELIKFAVTVAGNAVAGTYYLFGFLDDA